MSPEFWRRKSDESIVNWADRSGLFTALAIVALIGLSWTGAYAAGGSHTVLPHLFYVPVIVTAARFGHGGALAVSILAGFVAGPLLPLDVGADTAQQAPNWGGRLAAFVIIGQITAALHSRSLSHAQRRLSDWKATAELRRGLDGDEFVPVYQAIVDLEQDRVIGFEALARWERPDGELLGPDSFIVAAERTGMIDELGLRILEQACEQLAEWARIPGSVGLRMSVNVSRRQLDDPDLPAKVERVIKQTGIDPTSLVLEVTETALASDRGAAARSLTALRALGPRIALDDFGIGHSSLSALHEFPLDIVKIDRSFVTAMATNDKVGAVIEAIVTLAKASGMAPPVAEGIETPEQLRAVAALGCGAAQGYLLARPMTAEDARSQLLIPHLAHADR